MDDLEMMVARAMQLEAETRHFSNIHFDELSKEKFARLIEAERMIEFLGAQYYDSGIEVSY